MLPLALLAWAHLAVLGAAEPRVLRRWAAVAVLGDVVLLAGSVAQAGSGAAPLTLAMPVIAALLVASTIGLAWRAGETQRGE